MLVSNSAGLYLVLFAVVMGVAALIALFVGGARAESSPELQNEGSERRAAGGSARSSPCESPDRRLAGWA